MDYIIHKYGKVKGFVGKCKSYESLDELFQYIIPERDREGVDFQKDGITTDQLKSFCCHFKLPMYAIDDDKKSGDASAKKHVTPVQCEDWHWSNA